MSEKETQRMRLVELKKTHRRHAARMRKESERLTLSDAFIRKTLAHNKIETTYENIEHYRAIMQIKRSAGFFRAIATAGAIGTAISTGGRQAGD
jgi:hypothetical protein